MTPHMWVSVEFPDGNLAGYKTCAVCGSWRWETWENYLRPPPVSQRPKDVEGEPVIRHDDDCEKRETAKNLKICSKIMEE